MIIRCPSCKTDLQVHHAPGTSLSCPQCAQEMLVPEAPAAVKTEAAPAPVPKTPIPDMEVGHRSAPPPLPASLLSAAPAPAPPPAASPPERMWHYRLDGEKRGPIRESDLNRLIRRGTIFPGDLVWSVGMSEWSPANEYFEFPRSRDDDWEDDAPRPRRPKENQAGYVCSLLSCIFGGVAIVFCPPLFGLAGLVLGVVGTSLSRNKTLGIVGIVVSVVCTILGMIIGAAMWHGRLGPMRW
ncbi:MAG: DUF4339 domain-containing protein [Planctomycetes bacterium]|nr:DUF4339 domain-containing protein [Planctomycetota bacterium]